MTIAEVTVQYINQRKGNLPASIKDTAGAYYTVPDEMLNQFQEKQSYKIEYDLEEARNGKAYKVVKRAKLVGANLHPTQGGGHDDPELAERIFVCGALNAMLSNPNLKPDQLAGEDIAGMVVGIRQAWAATLGSANSPPKTNKAPPRDDMDDEITW